jgi:hypothetical protein
LVKILEARKFIMDHNRKIAKEHYDGINHSGKIVFEVSEEEFVENYPLSCIRFVSPKRFWAACYNVGVVKQEFYDTDEDTNPFESELRYMINEFRFSDTNDDEARKVYEFKVEELFKKKINM